MTLVKPLVIISLLVLLLSCGIDEYYYLPQLSEGRVTRSLSSDAVIEIPSISSEYYYATGFILFYRIYISNFPTDTIDSIGQISTQLLSDYNAFVPFIDPVNTSSIPGLTTFSNRGYYELELEGVNIRNVLSRSGGTVHIHFPLSSGDRPIITFNNNEYPLIRSNGRGSFNPVPEDRYFFSSPDLNSSSNANSITNADVSNTGAATEYAYVSMYIVMVGQNPRNFSRLYSKPTHINIFRLPNIN